jgi:23S rRNA (pseudouridine1915-N3)-methyltransferase
MHINVLAIGTRAPGWVDTGVAEYVKRLPAHIKLNFTTLNAAARNRTGSAEKCRVDEGERLLKAIPKNAYVVALDERGEAWTSRELAERLEQWLGNYSDVALLIGGADGLSDEVRQDADKQWSLAPLTLPHALVRVVLAEQIYRAWTLLQGHPYHRD